MIDSIFPVGQLKPKALILKKTDGGQKYNIRRQMLVLYDIDIYELLSETGVD